jgi:signal transduction histidine kinase
LRNRFFIIILTALIISALGINFVHVYFFKNQRLKLIDKQITESSYALLESSEFRQSTQEKISKIDETISQVLQGSRIGKVFVIRDLDGKIIYESFNVGLLNTNLPVTPEWVAIKTESEYVRIRNLRIDGNHPRFLQVGLVLDRNFLNWEILDDRVIIYVTIIVIALFIASTLLTLLLLSPLRLLIKHLNASTANLINHRNAEPLPDKLSRYSQGFWARSDEFSSLLNSVNKLINRINLNYKLTRSWTLQMAHELKTPLAIILAETDTQKRLGAIPEKYSADIKSEVHQMSDIISQFLNWAELENSRPQKDLHALDITSMISSVVSRLEKMSPDRIQLHLHSEFSVFANPNHLDQLITNLISNALKYSPSKDSIEIITEGNTFSVKDHGLGIPKTVQERLGEPFNVGRNDFSQKTGNGLGLAWVATVSKLYEWKLDIKTSELGTKVSVAFPEETGAGE